MLRAVLIFFIVSSLGCASAGLKHKTTEVLYNNGNLKIEMNGNQYLTFWTRSTTESGLASTILKPKDLEKDIAKIKRWDKELVTKKNATKISKKAKTYYSAQMEIKYHYSSSENRYFTICFQDGRYTAIVVTRCGTVQSTDFDKFEFSIKSYPEALTKINERIKGIKNLK